TRECPAEDVFQVFFPRFLGGGHPLSRPFPGTAARVSGLQRAALRRSLDRRYRPDRIFVAMAGGARHEELVEQVGPALSGLTGKAATKEIPPPTTCAGVYPHRRDLEQTHLCLGVPCVSQLDPDWYAAYL